MKVVEIMTSPVITAPEDCSLEEAARMMLDHRIGCLPVVNRQGEMVGILTESDFTAKEKGVPFSLYRSPQVFGAWMAKQHVERMYEGARNLNVSEVMSRDVVHLNEGDAVEVLLATMLRSGFHRLPVLRDRIPVGIIARHDLLRLMCRQLPAGALS